MISVHSLQAQPLRALRLRAGLAVRRGARRLRSELCRHSYRDPGPHAMPTAMLVGAPRSGTTWVAEVIDSQTPCRLIFEPFNPDRVPEFARFHHFHYMRPHDEHAELLSFCTRLVSGTLRGRWIDSQLAHIVTRLRLIKDIRSSLMLRWFHQRFPEVPLLFLLRHPCAVVLSRMRLRWATDEDIQRFVCQRELVADYLDPYMDVVQRARTDEEKHAVIWCVNNLVPLQQFSSRTLTFLAYERLRHTPAVELPRVFQALGIELADNISGALRRPSRTTRARSQTMTREDTHGWTKAFTATQIRRVLGIVRAFGLDHLYDDGTMPLSGDPGFTTSAAAPVQ